MPGAARQGLLLCLRLPHLQLPERRCQPGLSSEGLQRLWVLERVTGAQAMTVKGPQSRRPGCGVWCPDPRKPLF